MTKYIDNDNFEIRLEEIKQLNPLEKYTNSYFGYNLSEEQIKILKDNGTSLFSVFRRPFFVNNKTVKVVHYLKDEEKNIYRRQKLNSFLKQVFGKENVLSLNKLNFLDDVYNDIDFLKLIKEQQPLIIFSSFDKFVFDTLKAIDNNIVYDMYDFFSGTDKELIDNSKVVFCSSKYQFNNIDSENKYYIPNGCTVKQYSPADKYKTKTAVYCGRNINKIDFNMLNLLKALNPDWNIEVIGIPDELIRVTQEENSDLIIKGWMNEEDLHKELSTCHLGLILIENSDMTKGQLSDKFFNYSNAHIPTLINEEVATNYSEFSDFVSVLDFEKLELDNYLKEIPSEKYENLMKECEWNNRFSQIMQIVKEKGLI